MFYPQLVQNIIDTFYGVTSWGKQAKTDERSLRKPRLGLHAFFIIFMDSEL